MTSTQLSGRCSFVGMTIRALTASAVVIATVTSAGCASARVSTAEQAAERAAAAAAATGMTAAEISVLDGCYDCLVEARAIYARLAVERPGDEVTRRLFETTLLIVLREKEISLDWRGSLQQARDMAPRVSPLLEPLRLIAAVEAVLPDGLGVPALEIRAIENASEHVTERIADEMFWIDGLQITAVVRRYINLSLHCSYPPRTIVPGEPPAARPSVVLTDDDTWLMEWRTAICGAVNLPAVQRLRAFMPRFAEASYFIAQPFVAKASETGGVEGLAPLEEAYTRFPTSAGITYLFGSLHQAAGNCSDALRYFDESLALRPDHELALLGRTVCLTSFKRSDEAIATSTRMIELGTPNVQDAFYWRAVNRHSRGELELARSDIDAARAPRITPVVQTMAGVIEHDQGEFNTAERDFTAVLARRMGEQNCTAVWYMALIFSRTDRLEEAAAGFERSMACYELSILQQRHRIDVVSAQEGIDPAFQQRRMEDAEETIERQLRQYYASAYNAAGHSLRLGKLAKARELLDIVAGELELAESVDLLREALKAAGGALPPTINDGTGDSAVHQH